MKREGEYRRYLRLRLGRSADAERELEEELEAHIAMRAEELVRRGETPERARAEALRRFGDFAEAKRRLRQSAREREGRLNRTAWFEAVRRDVIVALRGARKTPGHTAIVILTFMLGAGLTTSMYTIVDHVLLRALPYVDPERLVALLSADSAGNEFPNVSMGNWGDWREQSKSLAATALHTPRPMTVMLPDETFRVPGQLVVGDFFGVLGVAMRAGRAPSAEEMDGRQPLAVVSERFWRTRLNSDPQLSMRLLVDGRERQVAGVIPRGLEYPAGTDVYVGTAYRPEGGGLRNNVNWYSVARLRPGISLESARADLSLIARRIRSANPEALYSHAVGVMALRDYVIGDASRSLWLLMAGVVLVLLIACANIAGLSLTRASTRTQEVALRMAMGAGRSRVRVQLIVEVLVLAIAGGALGVLLAWGAVRMLAIRFGAWIPRVQEVALDTRILVFALAVTLIAGLAASLAPALRASRVPIRELIGNQRGGAQGGRNLPGAFLVSGEVALALILLTAGGLLLRSFSAVLSQDLGYDPAGVITADISLTPPEYRQNEERTLAFWEELLRRTREMPGVEDAGLANWIPTGSGGSTFVEIEGKLDSRQGAGYRIASDEYFASLRIPLLSGRVFDARDTREGERVVIVNRPFADEFWPGENPIGKRVRAVSMEGFFPGGARWLTVMGVVDGVRHWSFEEAPRPEMFVLYRQIPSQLTSMTLVVRANPAALAPLIRALRSELRTMDAGVGAEIEKLEDRVGSLVSERRLTLSLLGGFASLALLLAAIGVYGLISFAVARRTREIGIRAALGANRYGLLGLVLGNAFRIVLAGALAGLVGAFWLTRLIRAMLFQTSTADIVSYGTAALVILSASMIAALIPAWRASRADPLLSLKSE